jgi:hypothetical protein
MKRLALLCCLVLAGCKTSPPAPAVGSASASGPSDSIESEQLAQGAAEAWLALVDDGKSSASWTEAASLFKKAVDEPTWVKQLDAVRSPLGGLKSRVVKSRKFAATLPGAPDGAYVVIQFTTSFEHKQVATETVTPMKDTDGRWRVSGYFIK